MASGALVVVSGLPASGKSTLAVPLSRSLGLPLLDKDTIKEALLDSLGWEDEDASRRLGGAALDVLLALAETQPRSVVESHFPDRRWAAERLRALARPLVQVHCEAPPDVLAERILERSRSGERHPGHRDAMRPDGLAAEVEALARKGWPPLDLPGPTLRVDTSLPVDVEALAEAVRQSLA